MRDRSQYKRGGFKGEKERGHSIPPDSRCDVSRRSDADIMTTGC